MGTNAYEPSLAYASGAIPGGLPAEKAEALVQQHDFFQKNGFTGGPSAGLGIYEKITIANTLLGLFPSTSNYDSDSYPYLRHPASADATGNVGFNTTDVIGAMYRTAQSFLAGSQNLPSTFTPSSSATLENYGVAQDQLMHNSVQTIGTQLAADGLANIDSIIGALMAPFITEHNAQRDAEIAKITANAAANNGFFNSGLLAKITQITKQWNDKLSEQLALMNFEFRKLYKSVAVQAIGVMAGAQNFYLESKLRIEKHLIESWGTIAQANAAVASANVNAINAGSNYGMEQSKRFYANCREMWNAEAYWHRWQVEYYQLMANVAATNGVNNFTMNGVAGLLGSAANVGGAIQNTLVGAIGFGNNFLKSGQTGR